MGAIQILERSLQKDDTLRKRYQETINPDVKADFAKLNKWN